MNKQAKVKGGATPLSRAQKRLQYWRDQLAARKKPCNSMTVGSVGVSIQEDKKLDRELIEDAERSVKDWEEIVLAVGSYESDQKKIKALVEAAKRGIMGLEANGAPNCEAVKELKEALQQAGE